MQSKQLVNCDWLSFSVLLLLTPSEVDNGAVLNTPNGYALITQERGTDKYKYRAILYNESGEKVLTLLWHPLSKVINPRSMFVEVANRYLYSPLDIIPKLLDQIHPYMWQSLSRLDVACDFNPNPEQWQTILSLTNGTMYVTGKREGSKFVDYDRGGQRVETIPRQLSWGSKTSDFKVKLYNKTKEIHQPSPTGNGIWCTKPYIKDLWTSAGMDPNNIWRLECSLMGSSGYIWRGEPLDWRMATPDMFISWYWDMVANRFIIRKNEGHTAKRYDTIVDFLDIPDTAHYRIRQKEPVSEQPHTDHAATVKSLIKELCKEEVQFYPPLARTLLYAADTAISQTKLEHYVQACIGKPWHVWRDEYYSEYCDPQQ